MEQYEDIFNEETPTNTRKGWAYYMKGLSGSFLTAICRAYELADQNNKKRLRLAFPLLFEAEQEWEFAPDGDAYVDQLLSEAE